VVYVRTSLTLIAVLAIIIHPVVVMAMMMVVTMMHVIVVAVHVGVGENPRERADWR